MRIGIIGTGRMGRGLAELLTRAGHDVVVGSRTPGRAELPTVAIDEAVAGRDAVIVAVPHQAIADLVGPLSTMRPGTVVIDIANAVGVDQGRLRSALDRPHGRWMAELLPNAAVARAFTHVQDELLVSRATRQPHTWAVAVAADDDVAATVAEELVRDAGYVPVMIGDLDASDALDAGGPLFPNMYLPGDLRDRVEQHRA